MVPLSQLLARLGRVIRTLRAQAGYSQERFGFAVGVHRTYMGHLERGTANPTMKTLHSVAQRLGVTVLELLMLAMTEDGAEAVAADIPSTDHIPSRPGPAVDPRGRAATRTVAPAGRRTRGGRRRR